MGLFGIKVYAQTDRQTDICDMNICDICHTHIRCHDVTKSVVGAIVCDMNICDICSTDRRTDRQTDEHL